MRKAYKRYVRAMLALGHGCPWTGERIATYEEWVESTLPF